MYFCDLFMPYFIFHLKYFIIMLGKKFLSCSEMKQKMLLLSGVDFSTKLMVFECFLNHEVQL